MARVLTTVVVLAAALFVAAPAHAVGGNYVINGGTARQHVQVRAALDASSFNWSVVPARIVIHIVPGSRTHARKGHIMLSSRLVDRGRAGWHGVQHEYAHQVDFFLLGSRTRSQLNRILGGREWWPSASRGYVHEHHEYGCERFASTLAWAYWQSPDNALRPRSSHDESAALAPQRFRQLLSGLLRSPRSTSR